MNRIRATVEQIPRHRAPVRWFNAAGSSLARYGVRTSLREHDLLRSARKQTRLAEFGDEWFREPLRVLLDSMEREAALTPLGRWIQKARLTASLANRLRAHDTLHRHPHIEEIPIPTVIVIAGLQRTGTTLLHRLLAADPNARAVLSWEVLHPVPFPAEGPDASRRRSMAHRAQRALAYMAPEFFAIHPVEFDAPEEDVLLLDQSFMSQVPEAMMSVPTYARWLEGQDHRPAYRDLCTWLRLLHWQRPGRHWLLKSPQHLEHLDTLAEVFPRVVVVQTHRDPRRCVTSFCSMTTFGRRLFSDHVDPRQVAAHWVPRIGRMVHRAISVRDSMKSTTFVDVAYTDLVSNPVGEIERIYRATEFEWTPAVRDSIRRAVTANPPDKYGRHLYAPSDFGFTESDIERQFADYRARFSIAEEPRG